jgi:hypothetical protein
MEPSQFRMNYRVLIVAALLLMITAVPAFAATPLAGDGNLSSSGSYVGGESFPLLIAQSDATGSCGTQQGIAVLKFNLTDASAGISAASLQLTVSSVGLTGNGNVVLVPVSDTSFTSSAQGTLDPSDVNLAAPLVTIPFANVPDVGATLLFSSPALTTYLHDRRGGMASLGVAITGCTLENPSIAFSSSSGGAAPTLTTTPTAVTLSTFRAADPAVNWPLIAGLGALAAAVIGGLAVSRRRAARG